MDEEYVEESPVETEEVETPEEVDQEVDQPETPEDEPEQEETEQPQDGKKQPPVIPRKAYESEKEKRQRLERENQELRLKLETTAPPQKREPQTIEEHFDVDPARTLAYVEDQIRKAQASYDPDQESLWRNTKTDLVARGLLNQQQRATVSEQVARVNSEIYKAVPDFEAKRPEIEALAVEYGLTEQEARDIFNPAVVGESAARMAKVFAKVHGIVNAGKTAKSKEVKQPTKVEPAGTGGFSNRNHVNSQLARAKESGNLDDWAALLG